MVLKLFCAAKQYMKTSGLQDVRPHLLMKIRTVCLKSVTVNVNDEGQYNLYLNIIEH